MGRRASPSDLSDAEDAWLAPHLPAPAPRGRQWRWSLREILDVTYYVVRIGCQWRHLPHQYPPWPTVYWWFRRWRLDGTWEHLNAALWAELRTRIGRDPQPGAGIINSQAGQLPRRPVAALGRGAGLRLDRAEPSAGQGLRAAADTSEALICATMSRLMVRRLTHV